MKKSEKYFLNKLLLKTTISISFLTFKNSPIINKNRFERIQCQCFF